jgi:hypothetical protein
VQYYLELEYIFSQVRGQQLFNARDLQSNHSRVSLQQWMERERMPNREKNVIYCYFNFLIFFLWGYYCFYLACNSELHFLNKTQNPSRTTTNIISTLFYGKNSTILLKYRQTCTLTSQPNTLKS